MLVLVLDCGNFVFLVSGKVADFVPSAYECAMSKNVVFDVSIAHLILIRFCLLVLLVVDSGSLLLSVRHKVSESFAVGTES